MYLTIDIGGTKTLLAAFTADGEKKESLKFPTPEAYPDFLSELAKNFQQLETKKFTGAAIAVPGRIDRKAGVAIAFGNRPWTDVPIRLDLEKITGCQLIMENDAKAAGLSEALLIKNEYRKVLYMTISTGIGGALILDGRIPADFQDIEVGQMTMERGGKLETWEDFASGRAISQKLGKRFSDIDPEDQRAWYYIARQIAIGLIDVIANLTPEVIVMGGGAGMHLDSFHDRLMEELSIYTNPLLTVPPIVKAKNPEEAVIYGLYELIKISLKTSHAKSVSAA